MFIWRIQYPSWCSCAGIQRMGMAQHSVWKRGKPISPTMFVGFLKVWHGSIMLMVHNAQEITTSESVRVCLCIYMCIYVYTYKCIIIYVYYIYGHTHVYVYCIYIHILFFWFRWSCCELYDGSCKGHLCSESLFTSSFLLLPVLDLFWAFKLIMLSPSSRGASCHFLVLYPLRLRRHISQAFRLDVLWLLARQTPWGLLGWFLDVTSSTCWTSYILVLFNKRSFQSQIDNLSRCIFWDFGVMLFIHVY
jgi:hypothetical protein